MLPTHEQLRLRFIALLHRMVAVLAANLIPMLPRALGPLLQHTPAANYDTLPLMQLLNQLIIKQPAAMQPLIDRILHPVIVRVFKSIPAYDDPADQRAIRRAYYQMLAHLVSQSLSGVLTSATNIAHLHNILATVLQGCGEVACFSKLCFQLLRSIVERWLVPTTGAAPPVPQSVQRVFVRFTFEKTTPAVFTAMMQPAFDVGDAKCSSVLTEMAKLLKAICERCGAQYTDYLTTVYFPSIHCPAGLANEVCTHLVSS